MSNTQFKDSVNKLLADGNREFSTTLGVVARIDNNSFEIYAVQSNSGAYVAGEKFALGDSLSREVFDNQLPIARNQIDNSTGTTLHPLYRSLPIDCYIGAPIIIRGKPWGCVDFSSMSQRDGSFDERDVDRIKSLAAELSELIGSVEPGQPSKASNNVP